MPVGAAETARLKRGLVLYLGQCSICHQVTGRGSGDVYPPVAWSATVRTLLSPLGRPIDLHLAGGKLYVLEYTRPTNFKEGRGWLPGRILELTPKRN